MNAVTGDREIRALRYDRLGGPADNQHRLTETL